MANEAIRFLQNHIKALDNEFSIQTSVVLNAKTNLEKATTRLHKLELDLMEARNALNTLYLLMPKDHEEDANLTPILLVE